MKHIKSILLCTTIFLLCTQITTAQTASADNEAKPESFSYQDGDTTYTMQKYFLCIYVRGEKQAESQEAEMDLQKRHLEHISKMAEDGAVCMAGPFDNKGDKRGVLVFNTATEEQARALVDQDPKVLAGILSYEMYPWWAAKGSKLK